VVIEELSEVADLSSLINRVDSLSSKREFRKFERSDDVPNEFKQSRLNRFCGTYIFNLGTDKTICLEEYFKDNKGKNLDNILAEYLLLNTSQEIKTNLSQLRRLQPFSFYTDSSVLNSKFTYILINVGLAKKNDLQSFGNRSFVDNRKVLLTEEEVYLPSTIA
jgi:hypothetical protein